MKKRTEKERRFAKMREESTKAIRRAGMQLFARKGYGNTSMEEIAREAGISKGLIYNYFRSKQQLLEELIKEGISVLHHLECKVYESGLPANEMLKHLLEEIFRAAKEQSDYWKLYTLLLLKSEQFPNIQQRVLEFMEQSFQRMEQLFRSLGASKPKLEAQFFAASLDGVLMHYLFAPQHYPLEKMKEHLITRFSQQH